MPGAAPLAFPSDFLAHGAVPSAHASAHGSHRAAADAGMLEAYGYDGFPGNPLLTAGLIETRRALLRSLDPELDTPDDFGRINGLTGPGGLPPIDHPPLVSRWGGQPVAALAQFELMAPLHFHVAGSTAELWASDASSDYQTVASLTRPTRAVFQAQVRLVETEAGLRAGRTPEILSQVAAPIAYYAAVLQLQAGRHARTMAFINAALDFGYAVGMRFKHAFACPRPSEYSSAIQPIIEVPRHATLPAGHATEGHMLAGLFSALVLPTSSVKARLSLRRLAYRVACNRTVAGLHFPIDSLAGRLLGDALTRYVLARCGAEPDWLSASFAVAETQPTAAESRAYVMAEDDPAFEGKGCSVDASAHACEPSPILREMWDNARKEWEQP